jgi:hypothetical protein
MKYKPEDYLDTGFYSDSEDLEHKKEKIVKCRKSHKCASCQNEIKTGDHALLESGFLDGHPVSCYTCLFCIEEWLAESGQITLGVE